MTNDRVPTAMWRVSKAARFTPTAFEAHRETVIGVRQVEGELAPLVEQLLAAGDALAVLDSQRKVQTELLETHVADLHQRALFWLTYVRMDVPGYEASEMPSGRASAERVIGRAQRMLNHMAASADARPYYADKLTAEITPLLERVVRERGERETVTLRVADLERQERELLAPVYRHIITLRTLLRNALGANHPHVRALSMEPPKRRRKNEEATQALPTAIQAATTTPSTAERKAIGQA